MIAGWNEHQARHTWHVAVVVQTVEGDRIRRACRPRGQAVRAQAEAPPAGAKLCAVCRRSANDHVRQHIASAEGRP